MNSVNLVGRVTKDVELRKSSGDKSYVFFTLAVDAFYNGEKQTQFIPCVAWNNIAENISKYVSKGSLISVEGSINVRNDKKDDGTYNSVINVMTSRVSFLTRPSDSQQNNYAPQTNAQQKAPDENSSSDDDAILWDY